LNITFSFWNS